MGQRTLDAAVHDGLAKLMKGVQVTHLLLDEEAGMMTFLGRAQRRAGWVWLDMDIKRNMIYVEKECWREMEEEVELGWSWSWRCGRASGAGSGCVCQTSVRVGEKAAGMAWEGMGSDGMAWHSSSSSSLDAAWGSMRACMQVPLADQIPGNNTGCQYGVGEVRCRR